MSLFSAPKVPEPPSRGAKPSDALVDVYHAKYIAALVELYNTHAPTGEDGKPRELKILKA